MSQSHRRRAVLVASPLIALATLAGGSAALAQSSPGAPSSEGPWPPRAVLGADPAQVTAPSAAAVAPGAGCPAAPYGVNRYAPGSPKTVALTFDDGPGKTTWAILSILQRYGVPATFFNVGVNQAIRPTSVRQEATLGLVLGNHTWDHPQMPTLSASGQASEMDKTTAEQTALIGRPPCVFRPPYGEYNATTLSLAQQRHMAVWNWSVDTEDWKAGTSTSSYWVNRIISLAESQGGALLHPVILMHNPPAGIPATVSALPTIISFFARNGYRFVTLTNTTGQGYPGPAATATASGLHVFARATSGGLTEKTRASNGTWSGWVGRGGTLVGGPGVIPLNATTSAAFVAGTDNRTWEETIPDAGGASGWTSLGGLTTSRPSAANGPDGVVTVVIRGADSAAWMRQQVAGRWGGWQPLGGVFNTGLAVAATPGGGLVVVGVGADNALWARNRTGGTWSGWYRVGGLITDDPSLTVTPSGNLLAVVRGPHDAGWVSVGNANGIWSGWQSIGGALASAPTVTTLGSTAEVFVYSTNGLIYENVASSPSTASGWSGWHRMP